VDYALVKRAIAAQAEAVPPSRIRAREFLRTLEQALDRALAARAGRT